MRNKARKRDILAQKKGRKGEAAGMRSAAFDPSGSYTGVSSDPAEKPIQDADDL